MQVKQFKKSDLLTGDVIVTEKHKWVVMLNTGQYVKNICVMLGMSDHGFIDLESFNDELACVPNAEYDILQVLRTENPSRANAADLTSYYVKWTRPTEKQTKLLELEAQAKDLADQIKAYREEG